MFCVAEYFWAKSVNKKSVISVGNGKKEKDVTQILKKTQAKHCTVATVLAL